MNDQQVGQLITALNNLEEDVEATQALIGSLSEDISRLSTAIEHWEVVHTAKETEANTDGFMPASEAMTGEADPEDGVDLIEALEEHYAAHDVAVELTEVDGKIYVAPQQFVGEDTFMELFGGNDRVEYDPDAPKGRQNWLDRVDVRGYIRETS